MPKVGLEPTRPNEQQILSLLCLPIPPLRLDIKRPYDVLLIS